MSHGVTPFSVSLTQLREVVGSRSKSILRELREEFEEELLDDEEAIEEANLNEAFDPELPLSDALRHLVMDEERWDYEGAKYGFAVELLCSYYGLFLPNDHWQSTPLEWIETVNDVLIQIGVAIEKFSIFGHLLYRGCPVEIPEIEDFPYIGYVELSEIPDALESLSDELIQSIKHRAAPEIRQAILQVREWLEACEREKSDLVCFFY